MKVRVRFSRRPPASMLSHLQQIETIRHGLRESGWPLFFGEKKKSKPRASFGPSVAQGYESDAEYADVELADRLDWGSARETLGRSLPEGLAPEDVKSVPIRFPSIEEACNIAVFLLQGAVLEGTRDKWEEFEKAESFPVEKKKKDGSVFVEARPLVKAWDLKRDQMTLTLRFGPGRTVKPERLAQAVCGGPPEQFDPALPESGFKVRRISLGFETKNGEIWEL